MVRRPRFRAERVLVTLIAAAILLAGAWTVLGPEERIGFLFYDDAFYYLGVARNLARGFGSTFDGINPTNGYHPLWCWLLTPVFFVFSDPGAGLRAAGVVWFTLAGAAPVALWWSLRPRTGPTGALIAAALFGLHPFVGLGLDRPNGLETPLFAFLLALSLRGYERLTEAAGMTLTLPDAWKLGVLIGAVTLARLDGGFLGPAAALLILSGLSARRRTRGSARKLAAMALGAALLAGPSLVWSTVHFGSPLPVSGRVLAHHAAVERAELGGALSVDSLRRRAFYSVRSIPGAMGRAAVRDTLLDTPVRRAGQALGPIAILVVASLFAAGLAHRRHHGSLATDGYVLLGLFCLLHYAAYGLWLWTGGETEYRLYYFMPEWMLVSAAAGTAVGPWIERLAGGHTTRRAAVAILVGLLAVYLFRAEARRLEQLESQPGPIAGRHIYGWIRTTLPPGAILGARDAGKLGYFSGRAVVNLDGLINDHRLLEAIREDREDEYVLRSPIRYLLFDRPWLDGFDPAVPSLPPSSREGPGELLYRLARREDCSLREIPGATDDWVVVELIRE